MQVVILILFVGMIQAHSRIEDMNSSDTDTNKLNQDSNLIIQEKCAQDESIAGCEINPDHDFEEDQMKRPPVTPRPPISPDRPNNRY